MNRKRDVRAMVVVLVILVVYSIPHSIHGSTFDYETGEHGNERLVQAWEDAIVIALEAIVDYEATHFGSAAPTT